MSPLHFIDQQWVHYAIQQLCQLLGVVPSRYYAWRHASTAGDVGTTEPVWETEMLVVFDHYKRRYGTQCLQVELREKGHRVGHQVCARACTGMGGGRSSPKPSPRAPPIRPTAGGAS